MFAPDVEARFKRIEDAQIVAAELLDRFERETRDRIGHFEAVQDAMAEAQDAMAKAMGTLMKTANVLGEKVNAIADAHIRLADTVDRFLKSRTNGGTS